MGVFARLFRRSKTKEETSTAEAQADQPSAVSEADGAAEAKASEEKGSGETDAGAGTEPAAAKEGDKGDAPEAVDIPQQQSPGKAADSEADENART
ncbi:hypothetical protein I2W78_09315 [Streptomyces spinoverrucosus]|uniref:hypothetical protein n=1 Tax=Streptomyces spinoverrucosus TaxID=284043 RepID=UPI0018C39740|nr:hypothetical protein [Streptomyces spinoverrucosus]MBG0852039.1 hypothetical protein [Streptomyces spinoverrucosus]